VSKPPLRVPVDALASGERSLPDDAATYVTRVHRLVPGDLLLLFDPERACEADAEILDAGKRAVTVRVGEPRAARRPAREITLIQGVGKGDKLDAVVRDATELGATRIVPALCERSVARPDAARAVRWRRIAVEAARQCGRGDVPALGAPIPFAEAIREARGDARICLDPRAAHPLSAALLAAPSVAFAVGPEGGLSDRELALAEEAGFARASLGAWILRTETVCAAVLGAIAILSSGSAPA
jgi:16S rRNA (uracil1498-N3)-methyltransferase